jgi:hypothetical protein
MARPKDKSKRDGRGNSDADQRWIEQYQDMLVRVDGGEWDGLLQWQGTEEEIGNTWVLPPQERRCTAKAAVRDEDGHYVIHKDGHRVTRPCLRWPMRGSNVCMVHGGGTQASRARAQERLQAAAERASGILVKIALDEGTPIKQRLRALEGILDRTGIRSGVDIALETKKYQDVWDEISRALEEERQKNG